MITLSAHGTTMRAAICTNDCPECGPVRERQRQQQAARLARWKEASHANKAQLRALWKARTMEEDWPTAPRKRERSAAPAASRYPQREGGSAAIRGQLTPGRATLAQRRQPQAAAGHGRAGGWLEGCRLPCCTPFALEAIMTLARQAGVAR